jgi:hypothetical protein
MDKKLLTREQWVKIRLRVLHQLHVFEGLSGASRAARIEQRVMKRHTIAKSIQPLGEDFGTLHVEEIIARSVNVGGIVLNHVSGRERNWHKREWKHLIKTLSTKTYRQGLEHAPPPLEDIGDIEHNSKKHTTAGIR